jgi:plastocyanin
MKLIRRSRVLAVLVALSLGAFLAACGDDDDASDAGTGTTTTAGESDGGGAVIEVELIDFEFIGLPARASVGDRITIVNSSVGEVHEVVVLRLPDGEDRPLEELLALPEEEIDALFVGMPEMVLVAAPGGPQIDAVGDGTLTQTGRFVVICAIPTGADPDEFFAAMAEGGEGPPQVDGGPPHFVHGMVGEIVVE